MKSQPLVTTALSFLLLYLSTTNHTITLISLAFFVLPLLLRTWRARVARSWHKVSANAPSIPGPMGWPFIGSLHITGPLMHRKLAALSEAHGARRLMAFRLGATPMVISSHPDTAREILAGPAFRDRPAKAAARELMFERAIGFAPQGEYWRRLQRIAGANMFSPRCIASSEWRRQRVSDDMVAGVRKEMEDAGKVVLRGVLQRASLDSMVGSVIGWSLGEIERAELAEMVKEGYDLIGRFNMEDYYMHTPLRGVLGLFGVGPRCTKLATKVKELFGKVIEERRVMVEYMGDDLLSLMLSLPKEERLEDTDVIAVVWEMILRGTDVVAILLEWIMARMVLHPDIQSNAQRELDAVVGARPVTDSDIPSLRFLQCIVKEALRMHPPGPLLSWARLAVQDARVAEFTVPVGTTAMVNMWAIAHDESIWTDPWAFRPERFLEDDVNVLGSDLRLAPFGSGRRVCPGRALGLATVHLWAARLLQVYSWTPAQPVKLSESLRLSMEMEEPLVCHASRQEVVSR